MWYLHFSSFAQGHSSNSPFQLHTQHSGMPKLSVTYNTLTSGLDLELTILCIDNKPTKRKVRWLSTTCRFSTTKRISQRQMQVLINLHLEAGGVEVKGTPQQSQRVQKERAKTDWHCKGQLIAEFKGNLQKLTSPTRRVLLPPPGMPYPEVIQQIMLNRKRGWRTQPEIPSQASSEADWCLASQASSEVGWCLASRASSEPDWCLG